MIAGIVLGIGTGFLIAVVIFARLIITANKKASGNGDKVLELLERKANAVEMISRTLVGSDYHRLIEAENIPPSGL